MNRNERNAVVARDAALHLWMGKRCSYHPSELPEGLDAPTNEERGEVELFDFNVSPPSRYTAYMDSKSILQGKVTTFTGLLLGRIVYVKRGRRELHAVNGRRYFIRHFPTCDLVNLREIV